MAALMTPRSSLLLPHGSTLRVATCVSLAAGSRAHCRPCGRRASARGHTHRRPHLRGFGRQHAPECPRRRPTTRAPLAHTAHASKPTSATVMAPTTAPSAAPPKAASATHLAAASARLVPPSSRAPGWRGVHHSLAYATSQSVRRHGSLCHGGVGRRTHSPRACKALHR